MFGLTVSLIIAVKLTVTLAVVGRLNPDKDILFPIIVRFEQLSVGAPTPAVVTDPHVTFCKLVGTLSFMDTLYAVELLRVA